jgi:hypothetical protein
MLMLMHLLVVQQHLHLPHSLGQERVSHQVLVDTRQQKNYFESVVPGP